MKCLTVLQGTVAASLLIAQEAKVTPLMTKELAGISGKEGVMLTVEYAPGASSPSHRHNAHTFVYVLEGSVVMQVAGGKEVTVGPGGTFYETPDDIHAVSKREQLQTGQVPCIFCERQGRRVYGSRKIDTSIFSVSRLAMLWPESQRFLLLACD